MLRHVSLVGSYFKKNATAYFDGLTIIRLINAINFENFCKFCLQRMGTLYFYIL
jgi:hypothetical protein